MLYRASMIGIIAFWLVMMGLLVRLETHPEATDILDVPVSYVMRLMFTHGQPSLLTVSDGRQSIGTISLRPSVAGSDSRSLDFSGTVSFPQRFNFNGTLNMDGTLRMRDFRVEASLRQPPYHLNVTGDNGRNRLTYEVSLGSQRVARQTLPMEAAALAPALAQNLGVDPHALPMSLGSISPPVITARETQIALHGNGEPLEVYDVTVTVGTTPVIDLYVTQLGQIVLAKTTFGYSLSAEDWQ